MKKDKQKQKFTEGGAQAPPFLNVPSEERRTRVRILKPMISAFGPLIPGMVIDLRDVIATIWIKAGYATEDRILDGPEETK